jgi:hypothetical protein
MFTDQRSLRHEAFGLRRIGFSSQMRRYFSYPYKLSLLGVGDSLSQHER